MQTLPESLASSAERYGLTKPLLSHSMAHSESVIQEQIQHAAKTSVNKTLLDKAITTQESMTKEFIEVNVTDEK